MRDAALCGVGDDRRVEFRLNVDSESRATVFVDRALAAALAHGFQVNRMLTFACFAPLRDSIGRPGISRQGAKPAKKAVWYHFSRLQEFILKRNTDLH